jgi:hypothetical protein
MNGTYANPQGPDNLVWCPRDSGVPAIPPEFLEHHCG